jgi:hypothetical protein
MAGGHEGEQSPGRTGTLWWRATKAGCSDVFDGTRPRGRAGHRSEGVSAPDGGGRQRRGGRGHSDVATAVGHWRSSGGESASWGRDRAYPDHFGGQGRAVDRNTANLMVVSRMQQACEAERGTTRRGGEKPRGRPVRCVRESAFPMHVSACGRGRVRSVRRRGGKTPGEAIGSHRSGSRVRARVDPLRWGGERNPIEPGRKPTSDCASSRALAARPSCDGGARDVQVTERRGGVGAIRHIRDATTGQGHGGRMHDLRIAQ